MTVAMGVWVASALVALVSLLGKRQQPTSGKQCGLALSEHLTAPQGLGSTASIGSKGFLWGRSHLAETLHDCAPVLRWVSAQVGFLEEEGMLVMCREAMGSKVPEGQRGGKSWPTLSLWYLGETEGLPILTVLTMKG